MDTHSLLYVLYVLPQTENVLLSGVVLDFKYTLDLVPCCSYFSFFRLLHVDLKMWKIFKFKSRDKWTLFSYCSLASVSPLFLCCFSFSPPSCSSHLPRLTSPQDDKGGRFWLGPRRQVSSLTISLLFCSFSLFIFSLRLNVSNVSPPFYRGAVFFSVILQRTSTDRQLNPPGTCWLINQSDFMVKICSWLVWRWQWALFRGSSHRLVGLIRNLVGFSSFLAFGYCFS